MTNTIVLSGRLANDPQNITTNNGNHGARFTVANSRDKNTTYFFDCVVYGSGADFITEWFKKGSGVDIVGRLEYYDKEKDGRKYRNYQIVCSNIDFPVTKAGGKLPKEDNAEW